MLSDHPYEELDKLPSHDDADCWKMVVCCWVGKITNIKNKEFNNVEVDGSIIFFLSFIIYLSL